MSEPRKIKMLKTVYANTNYPKMKIAFKSCEYDAWTNSCGGVFAIVNGIIIGLKQDEFKNV